MRYATIAWTMTAGLCIGLAAEPAKAQPGSATVSLVPIGVVGGNPPGTTINGDEIVLTTTGVVVELQLLHEWTGNLSTAQVKLDAASGYASGAGVDLNAFGWPANPGFGAYITTQRCFFSGREGCNTSPSNGLPPCNAADPNDGPCVAFARYIFPEPAPIAVLGFPSLDYEYLNISQTGGHVYNVSVPTNYAGTLKVEVPVGAAGTYTLGFDLNDQFTFLVDQNLEPLTVTYVPARISIACQTNADCNDNNACTDDVCNQQTQSCESTPNYDDLAFCCDPTDGSLTAIDDGVECTDDVCDPGTGAVTHDPLPAGTACGDPADTECDNPDSCDGAGVCDANAETAGTACGDPTDTECNGADVCDGNGACDDNLASAGTACGDPSDTDCTNPDSCDGAGTCAANDAPNGSGCDDGLFCNVGESCTAGVCGGGSPRNCSDGLSCTTDVCNEGAGQCESTLDAGNCLILNVCFADGALNPANDCEECDPGMDTANWSFLASGTQCDDGDPCTGTGRPGIGIDTCDGAGVCAGTPDPECNDQCAFAIPVAEGSTNSNINASGADDVEATCQPDSNNDIWFVYTAMCTGDVFMSTTGSALAPSNDPVLSVYDACPDNGGNEIACDDDSGLNLQAALTFPATSGVDYYIRIAGFEQNVGPVVLNIAPVDDCLIDGVCYAAGALNPNNDCEACIPALTTFDWSPAAEGTPCGDPSETECDDADACDGAGICEQNFKPDGTDCTDDGNECTFDFCSAGDCSHPPVAAGTACGDPSDSECDNPDSCDGAGLCLDNFEVLGTACGDPFDDQCDNPDICDGSGLCSVNFEPEGTGCDDTDICTEADQCELGACVGTPIPEAPLMAENGPRSLTVTPQPAGAVSPVALRVTSPDWPCLDKFVQGNGTLGDTALFQLPDDWATISLVGVLMVPSSTYLVEEVCGAYTSPAGSATTCQWCDLDCSGSLNGGDILFQVNGFQGDFSLGVSKEAMDVEPCTPNGIINGTDILRCVRAFQFQETYAQTGCPLPCP